jgi:integrase
MSGSVTISRGKISRRTWRWQGRKRTAFGFDIMVDDKRTRRQFPTRAEAQEALDQFREEARRPAAPKAHTITFSEAATRYLAIKARAKSLPEVTRTVGALVQAFGSETLLTEITAAKISAWRAARLTITSRQTGEPLSPASVNRPLAELRHLLRLAHEEWEVLPAVPKIRMEKEAQGRLRWLMPGEAERLLEACRASRNPALVDLVEFCLFTGLRQAEALELTWDRVERARGVVLLELTKNGRRREIPLNGRADAVLARRRGESGLVFGARSFDRFRSAWEAALRRARVSGFHFHDLRHTCASWAVQRGATLQEVKELLGHSSLSMVLRYAHLAPEHLRRAALALDGVLPAAASDNVARKAHGSLLQSVQEANYPKEVVSRGGIEPPTP